MIVLMRRLFIGTVISIFSLIFLSVGALGADIAYPQSIQTLSRTVQETNFYTLNIDSYIIPNATTLITAVSGNKIFIGDRPTRSLYIASLSGNKLILEKNIPVPAPLESGNKNNALLDMIATKDHLYLAVVDGASDYPTCGGSRIYDYSIANLAIAPKLLFKSTPCVEGDLFYDARLELDCGALFRKRRIVSRKIFQSAGDI